MIKKVSFALASFVFSSLFISLAAIDNRQLYLNIMKKELNRSMKNLSLKNFESPYFISYRIHDTTSNYVKASSGAIMSKTLAWHRANIYLELRVGDYGFDNTAIINKKANTITFSDYFNAAAPLEPNENALRNQLWLLTDRAYRKSLSGFYKKKGQKVFEAESKKNASFFKEKPSKYTSKDASLQFNYKKIKPLLKNISLYLAKKSEVVRSGISYSADKVSNITVNSEGSEIIETSILYTLSFHAETRADDGMLIKNSKVFYGRLEKDMPDKKQLTKEVNSFIKDLIALKNAPVMDPYIGPAILMPEAAGVLFHEALGHRLEGERQINDSEGRTFNNHLNKKVIPKFLSVIDDPTRKKYQGKFLNGFYRYDDESIKAQKAVLIQDGYLKGYLMSRTPVPGMKMSNGHGRGTVFHKPRGRMAVTMVHSTKSVSIKKLKKMLLAEIIKQKKPYGLLFKDISGGSTNTSNYRYQAFKGMPIMAYRVYADGREELVRGIEMVGTPLSAINKIVMTSDSSEIFNGYCGAESGTILVSAIAPAILTTEIELQRADKSSERKPILAKP